MRQQLALALIAIGVLLLIASFILPGFSNARSAISPEEYERLEELDNKVVDLHLEMAKFERKGNESVSPEAKADYDAIVAQRDELRDKLESGIKRPNSIAKILRYLGIAALLGGVIVYFVSQNADA